MSASKDLLDYPIFTEHDCEIVQFESTWGLEKYRYSYWKYHSTANYLIVFVSQIFFDRVSDKAIPIPTQTDPVNESLDKATNTNEMKHNSVSYLKRKKKPRNF